MTTSNAAFGNLAEELAEEILFHLSSIRSYEPQSTAFKDKKNEKARQRKNRVRQRALYAICLTSHCLRRIATPILYASFTGSATLHGWKTLQLFKRTICTPQATNIATLRINHAECLLYLENRLSDYLGNNLYDDMEPSHAENMVANYFCMLADVIRSAPNLQHLSVVSLETTDVSLWGYLLPGHCSLTLDEKNPAGHGLTKLQTLCLQIHMAAYDSANVDISFHDICLAMTRVPLLSDFRASGVATSGQPLSHLESGSFKRLQRLEITECVLDFDEITDILTACEGLRHITCAWAYLDETVIGPCKLYTGLLQHVETVESLHLDLHEVRFEYSIPQTLELFGTLKLFTKLKSLTISWDYLLGWVPEVPAHFTPSMLIADLLPSSLEIRGRYLRSLQ
jgi:hypothetical protein